MSAGSGRGVGALTAHGLEVRYDDRTAVAQLDLTFPAGSMVAVTGSSGSGKSSLLCAFAGLTAPTTGTVSLDGVEVHSRTEASRLGIGFLPQDGGLVSILTVEENVVVALLALGVDPADAIQRARTALAVVGLDDEGSHLAEELSGGQQQRAAIAVLLAARARVLLLDEPTSELDAVNRQRILAALRAEALAGAIVVVATHDPEAAAPADAELALDEGVATWVRPLQT
jgi:putative ABC transport system ATP-binding protein